MVYILHYYAGDGAFDFCYRHGKITPDLEGAQPTTKDFTIDCRDKEWVGYWDKESDEFKACSDEEIPASNPESEGGTGEESDEDTPPSSETLVGLGNGVGMEQLTPGGQEIAAGSEDLQKHDSGSHYHALFKGAVIATPSKSDDAATEVSLKVKVTGAVKDGTDFDDADDQEFNGREVAQKVSKGHKISEDKIKVSASEPETVYGRFHYPDKEGGSAYGDPLKELTIELEFSVTISKNSKTGKAELSAPKLKSKGDSQYADGDSKVYKTSKEIIWRAPMKQEDDEVRYITALTGMWVKLPTKDDITYNDDTGVFTLSIPKVWFGAAWAMSFFKIDKQTTEIITDEIQNDEKGTWEKISGHPPTEWPEGSSRVKGATQKKCTGQGTLEYRHKSK